MPERDAGAHAVIERSVISRARRCYVHLANAMAQPVPAGER